MIDIAAAKGTDPAASEIHISALLSVLGPKGVAVLLAVGALVLTVKSKSFRKAEARLVRATVRQTARLIVAAYRAARGIGSRRATAEERRLLRRLAPGHWREHAAGRGLDGTLTGRARLTDAGITVPVRLTGTWTAHKLSQAEEHVRALLGARTGLPIEVKAGKRGGWAELMLRTHSVVNSSDLRWTPERQGIGVDTHTGKVVTLPHGRKLIAGTSGAGKSVLLRTVLAPYVLDPLATVIYIDAKGEESALWAHCAREAIDADDIAQLVADLVAEMLARRDEMRARKVATWVPTPERPRLVVLVDEGADLMALDSRDTPIIDPLCQIARQGRSRLVDLIWCTQKPTVGDGIPRQIIGNMDVRVVLRTAGQSETQQVMGSGWRNHLLTGPGLAYVKGTGRDEDQAAVSVWDASDDRLITSLPAAPVWSRQDRPAHGSISPRIPAPPTEPPTVHLAEPTGRPTLSLVKDAPAPAALTESQTTVLGVVAARGPIRQKDIAEAAEMAKGTVSKAVAVLLAAGQIERRDGALVLSGTAAEEVSA